MTHYRLPKMTGSAPAIFGSSSKTTFRQTHHLATSRFPSSSYSSGTTWPLYPPMSANVLTVGSHSRDTDSSESWLTTTGPAALSADDLAIPTSRRSTGVITRQ